MYPKQNVYTFSRELGNTHLTFFRVGVFGSGSFEGNLKDPTSKHINLGVDHFEPLY